MKPSAPSRGGGPVFGPLCVAGNHASCTGPCDCICHEARRQESRMVARARAAAEFAARLADRGRAS